MTLRELTENEIKHCDKMLNKIADADSWEEGYFKGKRAFARRIHDLAFRIMDETF